MFPILTKFMKRQFVIKQFSHSFTQKNNCLYMYYYSSAIGHFTTTKQGYTPFSLILHMDQKKSFQEEEDIVKKN